MKFKFRRWVNIVPIFLGILIAVIVAELGLRAFSQRFRDANSRLQGDFLIYDPIYNYKYKPDREKLFTGLGTPTVWRFNNLGYRDRPVGNNLTGDKLYRIAFLGDSIVMGYGVSEDETLPWQLEHKLKPSNAKKEESFYEVMNFGIHGYGLMQYKAITEDTLVNLKPKPKLVILGFFVTDVGDVQNNLRQRRYLLLKSLPDKLIPYSVKEFLLAHSNLFLFLLGKYYNLIEPLSKVKETVTLSAEQILESYITSIKAICDKNGMDFVLVSIPHIQEVTGDMPSGHKEQLLNLVQKYNIKYLELQPLLKKEKNNSSLYINGTDTHFSPKGNEVAARIIADYLHTNNLLPQD